MGRPYSMDLRERVVQLVEIEGWSRRAVAEKLQLGASTVINWLRRHRETGTVRPGQMGGHKPRKISGEHRTWLLERCRGADFTIHGLVAEVKSRGLVVDYHTMWEFVRAEGFTYKKRQWSRPSRAERISSVGGLNG